jgi:hypothetical protein
MTTFGFHMPCWPNLLVEFVDEWNLVEFGDE